MCRESVQEHHTEPTQSFEDAVSVASCSISRAKGQEHSVDYCSSCRRHLNGALVCPGCGAYAPDIAPVTEHGHGIPASATPIRPEPHPYGSFDPFAPVDPVAPVGAFDDLASAGQAGGVGGVEDAAAAVPVAAGRAARRRQRARWKKSQRRAVVATAVALVGGGLTVASMDGGSGHGSRATAATDLSSMGSENDTADTSAELPSTGPGTGKHRKPSAGDAQSPATGTPAQRSGASAPHTASDKTEPYTAPARHSKPSTASQPQTASTPRRAPARRPPATVRRRRTSRPRPRPPATRRRARPSRARPRPPTRPRTRPRVRRSRALPSRAPRSRARPPRRRRPRGSACSACSA